MKIFKHFDKNKRNKNIRKMGLKKILKKMNLVKKKAKNPLINYLFLHENHPDILLFLCMLCEKINLYNKYRFINHILWNMKRFFLKLKQIFYVKLLMKKKIKSNTECYPTSKKILSEYFPNINIKDSIKFFEAHGGYDDVEIYFNVFHYVAVSVYKKYLKNVSEVDGEENIKKHFNVSIKNKKGKVFNLPLDIGKQLVNYLER